jgi:acetylornithine deacetylase/succinyl-diaminopimelate desuccinylase-like protein
MNNYIEENQDRFISELFDLLKIPSVSTDASFNQDIQKAAEFLREKLEAAGAEKVEVVETPGNPIVYGEKNIGADAPTVLVYGHYDVQPADPLDLWDSPPFEPVIKNNRIYARGACDDKGQMYMHVKALETMDKGEGVPCNIKFMIEGEEEIGSNNLAWFVDKYRDKLDADIILISDTDMLGLENPSICTGLRGLSYVEVELTGPSRDLHSGLYGGAVKNPINALCEMITSLQDENKRVNIPGFYDDVEDASEEEREKMSKAPFDDENMKKELQITDLDGETGYSTLERTSIRPTIDVNGIWGGYMQEGAKTVIASKAHAKISMRLVPNQSSEKITKLFSDHFESIAPKGTTVKISAHHGGEPAVTPIDSNGYRAAEKAIIDTLGKEPIPIRSGGSIPIVAMFKEKLGLDSVLFGFGLSIDAIHSPNESYGVDNFLKGIDAITRFHYHFSKG